MRSSSLPGTAIAVERPPETCTIRSASPWITNVGMDSRRSCAVRSGWVSTAIIWRITPLRLTPRS